MRKQHHANYFLFILVLWFIGTSAGASEQHQGMHGEHTPTMPENVGDMSPSGHDMKQMVVEKKPALVLPPSGKGREIYYQQRATMDAMTAEMDIATLCEKAGRGIIMLDRETLAQCSDATPMSMPSKQHNKPNEASHAH